MDLKIRVPERPDSLGKKECFRLEFRMTEANDQTSPSETPEDETLVAPDFVWFDLYGGFIRSEELSFERLKTLYYAYRQYMMEENQFIHERSVRGAGAQALVGASLGFVIGVNAATGVPVLSYVAEWMGRDVLNIQFAILAVLSLLGVAIAAATAFSIKAAYDSITSLSDQWVGVVARYLESADTRRHAQDDDTPPLMKADFLPSPVGGGAKKAHFFGKLGPTIVSWASVVLWTLLFMGMVWAFHHSSGTAEAAVEPGVSVVDN